ncbi:MAG: hypothetical protein ACK5Q5_24485 [Planctomycetaceae bacterium]
MSRVRAIWTGVFVVAVLWIGFRMATGGMGLAYVQHSSGQTLLATPDDDAAGMATFSWSQTLGIWVAAFMTLAILSFVYQDNPFYKLAEAIIVGVSAAYWMVVAFWTVLVPNLLGKLVPETIQSWAMPGLSPVRDEHWYLNLIPLLLGVMLLWRLAPKGAWIARWPLAFIIGTTAGLRLVHFLQADFLSQIHAGIEPLVVRDANTGSYDVWTSVQNAIVFFATLAALVYFFFSIEHTGIVGRISRVGIWVLMITFGAAFGFTVMGRIALLANRFEFLFDDWLWLIDPGQNRLML